MFTGSCQHISGRPLTQAACSHQSLSCFLCPKDYSWAGHYHLAPLRPDTPQPCKCQNMDVSSAVPGFEMRCCSNMCQAGRGPKSYCVFQKHLSVYRKPGPTSKASVTLQKQSIALVVKAKVPDLGKVGDFPGERALVESNFPSD